MTWLWILSAIVAFFSFLLFVGVKIHVSYRDEMAVYISLLGIRFHLFPRRKKTPSLRRFTSKRYQKLLEKDKRKAAKKESRRLKKEKKKRQKWAEEQKRMEKADGSSLEKDESLMSFILTVIGDLLDSFWGTLRVDVARIRINVGGKDAATTAISYGLVSQGVAYLLALLTQKTRYKRKDSDDVMVTADFLSRETTADVSVIFTLRLCHLLGTALKLVFKFIKEKISRASVHV